MNTNTDARSSILKYVSDNPGATAPQIIKALGFGKSNGAKMLMRMTEQGGLNRNDIIVHGFDSTGKPYKNKSFAYTIGKPGKTVVPTGIQQLPGYYSQRGGEWKGRSGEGQGAGRRVVYIGSSL